MKLKFISLLVFIPLFGFAANAQSGRKSNQPAKQTNQTETKREEKKEEQRGEIRPVKIIRKPAPDADAVSRCFKDEGFDFVKTTLRVTFDASAIITDIVVLNASGCSEFDEASVRAARKIKFQPAVQNDAPISVTKTVVYAGGVR